MNTLMRVGIAAAMLLLASIAVVGPLPGSPRDGSAQPADTTVESEPPTEGVVDPMPTEVDATVETPPDEPAASAEPFAQDDVATTAVDTPVVVAVLANDVAAEGSAWSVADVTQGANGAVSINPDNTVTYAPNAGFTGADGFTYTVVDGLGNSATANVTVTVEAPVEPPPTPEPTLDPTPTDPPVEEPGEASPPPAEASPTAETPTEEPTPGGIPPRQPESKGGFGAAQSSLVVDDLSDGSPTSQQLAESLVGVGVTISNVAFGCDSVAAGQFAGGGGTVGFDGGIVLSSGRAIDVIGPNTSASTTGFNSTGGDADLTALAGRATDDACVLEFDFVPNDDQVFFQYVFGSEEYNEFVGTNFNDVFGFFVNGQNCAVVGAGQPVAVNTINNGNPLNGTPPSNPGLYRDNDFGTGAIDIELDGLTVILTCSAAVTPAQTNHLKLAIADASDASYDSAVFIQAGSLTTNQPPVAGDDAATTDAGVPVTINVLANDSDPDGDTLTVTAATDPANGTAVVNADNTITYTPDAGFTGTDTFDYTVDDGNGGTDTATVTVTVNEVTPPTPAPTATTVPTAVPTTPPDPTSTAVPPTATTEPEPEPCTGTQTFDLRGVEFEIINVELAEDLDIDSIVISGIFNLVPTGAILDPTGTFTVGCTFTFDFTFTFNGVQGTGSGEGYIQQGGATGLRAFQTANTYELALTAIQNWDVPGFAAPQVPYTASITVSGPIVQVTTADVTGTLAIVPEFSVPFAGATNHVVAIDLEAAQLPGVGSGPARTGSSIGAVLSAAAGVLALLALAFAIRARTGDRPARSRRA
jgi:hypothetical protein